MHFQDLNDFLEHMDGWLVHAMAIMNHPVYGQQIAVQTAEDMIVDLAPNLTVRLDTQSKARAISAFRDWVHAHPNVNVANGVVGNADTPTPGGFVPPRNRTYWFPVAAGGQCPQGATAIQGYWRMRGLYWRPHP